MTGESTTQPPEMDQQTFVERRRRPHTRRADLMDAAEYLFIRRGLDAVTVEDITNAAQVAKGTFYRYFISREALLLALRDRFIEQFCEMARIAMDLHPETAFDKRLLAWFGSAIDVLLDNAVLHEILFHQATDSRHLRTDNSAVDQLAKLLGRGMAAGIWRVDDARLSALMCFHAMHGVAEDAIAARRTENRTGLARMLARTFSEAFSAAAR
jgi:AcrR family transcriptional regulator